MATYYDLDAANGRIGELRPLLEGLVRDRDGIADTKRELEQLVESNGSDEHAAELARHRERIGATIREMETAVRTIDEWGITLRDIGTGLVDFPALVNGRPVWLCWKLGEDDIAWWHEMDAGIDGRKPLIELE